MISKKKFVEIINRLKSYSELQDKINDLFKEHIDNKEMDFMNAGSICVSHEIIVLDLLRDIFNDYDIISWWIYECKYGTDFSLGDLIDNGKEIDLTTVEKLYDYLVQQKEYKECKIKVGTGQMVTVKEFLIEILNGNVKEKEIKIRYETDYYTFVVQDLIFVPDFDGQPKLYLEDIINEEIEVL